MIRPDSQCREDVCRFFLEAQVRMPGFEEDQMRLLEGYVRSHGRRNAYFPLFCVLCLQKNTPWGRSLTAVSDVICLVSAAVFGCLSMKSVGFVTIFGLLLCSSGFRMRFFVFPVCFF